MERLVYPFSKTFAVILLAGISFLANGQDSFQFSPNLAEFQARLQLAPNEFDETANPVEISLPNQNGEYSTYLARESRVVSNEMEVIYPDFKTYILANGNDKSYAGRLFVSRFGIEGMVITGNQYLKFEPLDKSNPTVHKSFILPNFDHLTCETEEVHNHNNIQQRMAAASTIGNGGTRRTYEIAIVTTGEFYQSANFGNNTLATANASVTNIINLNNVRYNIEMAIQFTIFSVPFHYTNPATDPFDPAASNRPDQAASAVNTNFPGGLYDLGHCLHGMTGGGSGVAGLGVVCSSTTVGTGLNKARGWSGGSDQNVLAVGIMIHEIGHMFNGPHTYNGTGSNCTAQISATNAVEIASGTTIMSYAGLCQANNNIQGSPDNYFHAKSHENFLNYIAGTGGTCSTNTPSGNTPPVVVSNPCSGTYTIPRLTPFSIQGSGSDANSADVLTYTWEQMDEDGAGTPTQGFLGTTAGNSAIAPLFRSYIPSTTGNRRTFPALNTILNNSNLSDFEPLPNAARTLNFRLTGRDNNATNGGIHCADLAVTVSGTTGPLEVTSPNTAVTWAAGAQTVTWNVNNTNTLFANVDILLSLDGGQSFPITLLTATANDGSESVTIPNVPGSTQARIKVRSLPTTCFEIFDLSNTNFTITSTCAAAPSNICQSGALTLPFGDPGLNLGLSPSGQSFSTFTANISGVSPIGPLANATTAGGTTCQTTWGPERYQILEFTVSQTGSYTFNNTSGGQIIFSFFSGATYNPAAPCSSSFLGSNASGAITWGSTRTLSLTACTTYRMVVWTLSGASGSPVFNLTGPGVFYSNFVSPGPT
jgi:hypothetical protein